MKLKTQISLSTGQDMTTRGDDDFNNATDDEKVSQILEWIKGEKKNPHPNVAAIKHACRDINEIKQDYRVVSHQGQYGNQRRSFTGL